jgi:hypothetical protein
VLCSFIYGAIAVLSQLQRNERAYDAGDERGGVAEHRRDDDLRREPGDLAAALHLALPPPPVRRPSPARVAALRRATYHGHPVPAVPGDQPAAVNVIIASSCSSSFVPADAVPALDEDVHDAGHVEAVAPALAPVAPAAAAVAAPVARAGGPGVRAQVQPDASAAGVERVRERGAAGVQVEAAGAAVVDVAGHVAAAGVAVARAGRARRAGEEDEGAARVERVAQRRGRRGERERALPVQVVVAAADGAPEPRADAHLAAPVAPERRVQVLQPQPVLRVAEVRHLAVPHRPDFSCSWDRVRPSVWSRGNTESRRERFIWSPCEWVLFGFLCLVKKGVGRIEHVLLLSSSCFCIGLEVSNPLP